MYYTNVCCFGNRIYCRAIDGDKHIQLVEDYSPTLFLPSNEESKFKTLDGRNVKSIKFDTIADTKEFISQYRDVDNFEFFGNTQYPYCYISSNFSEQIEYDLDKINICFLDIEVSSENGFPDLSTCSEPIISITMKMKEHLYVLGCKPYLVQRDDVHYIQCQSEPHLLRKFLELWCQLDIDIVSGWNIEFFDLPYLIARLLKIFDLKTAKQLSPWGRFKERTVKIYNKEHRTHDIDGVECLDYLRMYKKASSQIAKLRVPNYRLDTVAHHILKEKKISYDEYKSLHNFYIQNYQKFIDYNIRDVELIVEMDKKLQLISQYITIAYDAKVNYSDVFSQVRMWDAIIFNYFRENNIVFPQKRQNTKSVEYSGAYVKEVKPGLKNWVASFDLDSLYPHLIAQYNISPECLRNRYFRNVTVKNLIDRKYDLSYLKSNHLSMAANGHHFDIKNQGFLPKILMRMYQDRKEAKNKMLEKQRELEYINNELKRRGLE